MEYLRRNIGTFMMCLTAAGSAQIDLVELMIAHRDRICSQAKTSQQ